MAEIRYTGTELETYGEGYKNLRLYVLEQEHCTMSDHFSARLNEFPNDATGETRYRAAQQWIKDVKISFYKALQAMDTPS